MRVYRDTRFGKDKRPFKTNIGIQFRHEMGKDVHAPGYYLHIEPGDCFVGAGIWRPDAGTLGRIRDSIVENGDAWLAHATTKPSIGNFRSRAMPSLIHRAATPKTIPWRKISSARILSLSPG